jgi:hypothetical protein
MSTTSHLPRLQSDYLKLPYLQYANGHSPSPKRIKSDAMLLHLSDGSPDSASTPAWYGYDRTTTVRPQRRVTCSNMHGCYTKHTSVPSTCCSACYPQPAQLDSCCHLLHCPLTNRQSPPGPGAWRFWKTRLEKVTVYLVTKVKQGERVNKGWKRGIFTCTWHCTVTAS